MTRLRGTRAAEYAATAVDAMEKRIKQQEHQQRAAAEGKVVHHHHHHHHATGKQGGHAAAAATGEDPGPVSQLRQGASV